ncbi:Zn-dependent protease with chaperone function [Pedobacter steynii]|uniref:Zn-dependent protease with chaperone function n=1 Tax=Pedobacter steynii TaxID=430522 RepID=A0A1G9MYR6_9SPHI|nr:M48 family metallopeptidase [Pedobacter steynii]NQX39460.1 M48 family metalloprotease [Pedobacter steynii]SDL79264.1 Zn-dependent protease with chaperone function [Pedobacter steynii]
MNKDALKASSEFQKMAIRALASIVLFVFTYILLVIFAIGLTILCGYLGAALIGADSSWLTGLLGLSLVSTGIIVLIFVIKFIFKGSEQVKPLLVEIKAENEPELFVMIKEIVAELKTDPPKKVYLSPEVNAGVFYDSLFLSMFFHVRMNLQIGMGILNTHSREELKAVLAHEFGHFSQRSMRIGSYVHSANKVLHNLLYDNENFNRTIENWGDGFSYFKIPGLLASGIIKAMQSILKQVYQQMNANYYALSREMEFHADAVAASLAGPSALIRSFLRMELAETSLSIVHSYHENKVSEGSRPLNIYPQHYFVMNHLAWQRKIAIKNGLPEITPDQTWKLRRSKLALTDKWASHPSTEERIARIGAFSVSNTIDPEEPTIQLLAQREKLEEMLTSKIYDHHFIDTTAPLISDFEQFRQDFMDQSSEIFFDERYHEYYDERLPYYKFDQKLFEEPGDLNLNHQELFNDEGLSDIFELDLLEYDLNLLNDVKLQYPEIKDFSYDGTSYQHTDCAYLIRILEKQKEELKEKVDKRALLIFNYFKGLAQQAGKTDEWTEKYKSFMEVAELTFSCQDVYVDVSTSSSFMIVETPFTEIQEKMVTFKATETLLKQQIKLILESPAHHANMSEEQIKMFEKYLLTASVYFENNVYLNDELTDFSNVLTAFQSIYYITCYNCKKDLLQYQVTLFPLKTTLQPA